MMDLESAKHWKKQANTMWSIPIERLAPPPGTPASESPERVPATIVETSSLVPEADRLAEEALPFVEWEIVPPLAATERTAWMPLASPVKVVCDVVPVVQSLKLKGVGLGTLEGAVPPSGEAYIDELHHGHVGVTEDGHFRVVQSRPAPKGGMFFQRALAEFRNAETLLKAGCPSIAPIAVFKYENVRCDWYPEPFGAVLGGFPTDLRIRASGIFVADPGEDSEHGRGCARILEAFGPGRLEALQHIAAECGRTLRKFHEAGLFRHNGYPTNYVVDTERRQICLVDLDSSLPLGECSPLRRALEILRDVAGGLFGMGVAMLEPSVAARFPPSSLAGGRHFQRFIEGYFEDVDGLPSGCIEPFLAHFFERFEQVFARRVEIATSPDGEQLLNALWLSRPFCYSTPLAELMPVYERSALARRYPLGLSPRDIAARAAHFLEGDPQTGW